MCVPVLFMIVDGSDQKCCLCPRSVRAMVLRNLVALGLTYLDTVNARHAKRTAVSLEGPDFVFLFARMFGCGCGCG